MNEIEYDGAIKSEARILRGLWLRMAHAIINVEMQQMRNLIVILSAALFTACSGLPGRMSDAELKASNNVAVVSLLGDRFYFVRVGTTVFNNVNYEFHVPDWNIDSMVESVVVERLSEDGARKVSTLEHTPGISSRFRDSWSLFNNGFSYDEIFSLAKEQGYNALIAVEPTPYDNQPFHVAGYGFYERNFLGNSSRCIYTLFTINVYSIDDRSTLGWDWGFPCTGGETEIPWKAQISEYSVEELKSLRERTEENISTSVLSTLDSLGY